jgi:hypothetical protein
MNINWNRYRQLLYEDCSRKIQSISVSQLECNLNFNVNICTSQKIWETREFCRVICCWLCLRRLLECSVTRVWWDIWCELFGKQLENVQHWFVIVVCDEAEILWHANVVALWRDVGESLLCLEKRAEGIERGFFSFGMKSYQIPVESIDRVHQGSKANHPTFPSIPQISLQKLAKISGLFREFLQNK